VNQPLDPVSAIAISRRQLLQGGLLLGSAALFAGCASPGSSSVSLPDPVWPDNPRAGSTLASPVAPPPTPVRVAGPVVSTSVIPRNGWTTKGPLTSLAKPMNGVTRITVHHSAINNTSIRSREDAARMLRGIQGEHMGRSDHNNGKKWADIGYHYIIDPQGRIWEGRPTNLQGAHVKDTNEHNLGIMVMGNFDQQSPTAAQAAAVDAFVIDQMRRYRVPVARVYTHQELNRSACPGRNLQAYMLQTRRGGQIARA
jgi:hypothetical protein